MNYPNYFQFEFDPNFFDPTKISVEYLKPVGAAFSSQIRKINEVLLLPEYLAHRVAAQAQALTIVQQAKPDLDHDSPEGRRQLAEHFDSAMREFAIEERDNLDYRHAQKTASFGHLHLAIQELGDWRHFVALLEASIVSIHTAVEIFVADLWLAAVNNGDKSFFESTLKNNRGDPERQNGESKDQQKMIPISFIARSGYDLSKKMGDVLKESQKVKLDTLNRCASAYSAAFGPGHPLDASLLDFGNCLVLECVRNALLHRAGAIDEQFRRSVKKAHGSKYKEFSGSNLEITGQHVHDFAESAMALCTSLLEFVELKCNGGRVQTP